MNQITIQVEEKIHSLIEFLLKRRQPDGTIRTEIGMNCLPEHFALGKETLITVMKTYYEYSKGIMFPKGRGFKPTEAIFLREYRYQNSLHKKKYDGESVGNYLVVLNNKNQNIEVKEKKDIKPHHLVLSTCRTPEKATTRWQELMKEKLELN